MNTLRFGRTYLSPNADGGGAAEESDGTAAETVTAEEAKELTVSELASLKVKTEDGKVISGKEFTESWRKQPDTDRILNEKKAELQAEYDAKLKSETERISQQMESASTGTLNKVLEALQIGLGKGPNQKPLTREQKVAAIIEKMGQEGWNAGIPDLVDAGSAEAKALIEEIRGELNLSKKEIADLKEQRKQDNLKAFYQEETRAIQGVYPEYNPEGDDLFSVTLRAVLLSEKPMPNILGNQTPGNKTQPVEAAKKVAAYLETDSAQRLAKKSVEEKKRRDAQATVPAGRTSFEVSDELQKELAKAQTPAELAAVRRKMMEAQQ
jgi:hypothetical protein